MSTHDIDGEVDSLFGSPPPSPSLDFIRGGSPELALPGSQAATCATLPELPKNVGTIALPGSHDRSELSDSLPAHPPWPQIREAVHPTEPHQLQYQFEQWEGPRATSVPTTTSARTKTPRRPKKARSTTPHTQIDIRSALPSGIDLPHLLRQQPELLRLAEALGGARPMQLCRSNDRGLSKENPIVVDEEPTSQDVLPGHPHPPTSSPDSQAIADTLISQGGIFPVLRSLVPYLGLNTNVGCRSNYTPYQYRTQSSKRSSSSNITAPPLKRRKLNSVPAGAKEWDVPYPFPANEGPKNYLESWKKKRGKKLMMQLVSLVREAVQKATARTQTQQLMTSTTSVTAPPTAENIKQQVPAMDNDALMAELQSLAAGPQSTSSNEQEAMLSDFFPPSSTETDPTWNVTSDFDSLLGAVNDALNDPNVQLAGDDLAMMSSFPFSPTSSNSPTLSSSTRLPTPSDSIPPSFDSKDSDVDQFIDFNFDDISLDPSLLDFSSWPSDSPSVAQTSTGSKEMGDGPVPGVGEPSTPRQQDGFSFDQGSLEEIIKILNSCSTTVSSESVPTSEPTSGPATTEAVTQPNVASTELHFIVEDPRPAQNDDVQPSQQPSPTPDLQQQPQQSVQLRFKEPLVETKLVHHERGGPGPSTKKPNREEVLRRARIRREQLAAELARAKIELWETTIEQGVLTHLSKDKGLHSKS